MLGPIIAICGTTGVGKSKLAIELALKLSQREYGLSHWRGARIINADAMQVYSGMDILTNKVPVAEQNGIEHLLMGYISPGEQYVVGQWVQDAMDAIDETHARKQIPILVGGTSYWMQHLLFPDRLATSPDAQVASGGVQKPLSQMAPELQRSISNLPEPLLDLYNNLPQSSSKADMTQESDFSLHSLLSRLDPEIAARWHWRDTRKVLRNLLLIKETGSKASDMIIEQSRSHGPVVPRYRTLCFWLYADFSELKPRLEARVDEMLKRGLLDEVKTLLGIASSPSLGPHGTTNDSVHGTADFTRGIFQSIGYREFQTYLTSQHQTEQGYMEAIEHMKTSTRQYAKRQVSWIKNKLLPLVNAANALQPTKPAIPTYLLDATVLGDTWDDEIRGHAERIAQAFLDDAELPSPLCLSDRARTMMTVAEKPTDPVEVLRARTKMICPVCTFDVNQPFMVEEGQPWAAHQRTRTHRRLKHKAEQRRGDGGTRSFDCPHAVQVSPA